MTAHLIASLLLESEPVRFQTVLRSRKIEFTGGDADIEEFDGEAIVTWTGQLRTTLNGIVGIDIEIVSVRVWGDLITMGAGVYPPGHPLEGEREQIETQIDLNYPEGAPDIPDDADMYDTADVLSRPKWRVEISGETRMPARPDYLAINLDKRVMEVAFE